MAFFIENQHITYRELLLLSTAFLYNYGIESPQLNAQKLLQNCFRINKLQLINISETIVDNPIALACFVECINKRATNYPLQYIIGKQFFYNIELIINKNTLIPRPETEQLVDIITKHFIYTSTIDKPIKAVDICSGSGCIGLALAKFFNDSTNYNNNLNTFLGIDICNNAISVANQNKDNLKLNNISFINISLEEFIEQSRSSNKQKYNLITFNPPYISLSDYNKLDKSLYFEPRIALTDNNDGLTFFRIIADNLEHLLEKNGFLYLECAINQARIISEMFYRNGYITEIKTDFAGIERYLIVTYK